MRVIEEVTLAVQNWIDILEFFDLYEYVTRYDPQTGQVRLFVQYIDTLLKLKTKASVNPDCVRNPEVGDRYINNFYTMEVMTGQRDDKT